MRHVRKGREEGVAGTLRATLAALAALARRRAPRNGAATGRWSQALRWFALGAINDAVITVDRRGFVEYLNASAERLTEWPAEAARGKTLKELLRLFDEKTLTPLPSPEVPERERPTAATRGMLLVRPSGKAIPVEIAITAVRDADGRILGSVVVLRDVVDARQVTALLTYHASHDALTGLVNRQEFEHRLDQAIARAAAKGTSHMLCYLDLDRFKVVNDTCGHPAGDQMLRQIAQVLYAALGAGDTLARIGGDEFGVLIEDRTQEQGLVTAERLRSAVVGTRFTWDGRLFEIGVSIGVVLVAPGCSGRDALLSAVDVACYAAKDKGRNRVHLYSGDDAELVQRHGEMYWVSRINMALREERFVLYRQRIDPVRAPHLPYDHFEVLLRMVDESGALVPPDHFIPAAERYDLMPALDRWVVSHVFAYLAETRAGREDYARLVAINLSGASLGDRELPGFIEKEFRRHGVSPDLVCFEVTETAAIANLREATETIRTLRQMGCRFALDDFGSGLSSFAYLKSLPIDYLKIDGQFVRQILDNALDRTIVESVVRIGQVLGVETIAEFVEDEASAAVLREVGVDYVQGFGIEPPRPLREMQGTAGVASA